MQKTNHEKSIRGIAIFTSIVFILLVVLLPLHSASKIVIETSVFVAYLSLFSGIIGSLCGFIAIMSWMLYYQEDDFWHLVVGLICYNVFFMMFLFAFTYPGMPSSEILYATQAKTQVLVATLALIPSGGFLFGELIQKFLQNRFIEILYILSSITLCPVFGLIIVGTPIEFEPLYDLSSGITQVGLIVEIVYFIVTVSTIIYFLLRYWNGKYLMQKSVPFVLVLVLVSAVPLLGRTSAYQISNLYTLLIVGLSMVILAYAMIFDYSKNLHKSLIDQVTSRTEELQIAKNESDFYIYIYSHEVGNLLQSLQMYIDLYMSNRTEEEIENYEHFHTISQNVARVIQRVRQLADVGLQQELKFEPIDLDLALRRAVDILNVSLRDYDFDVEIEDIEKTVDIKADDLLILLFVNLLENSVKHNDKETPEIKIIPDLQEDECEIEFQDNGPKLEEHTIKALNEEQSIPNEGLGAGLYIVKKLTNLYGGTIEYQRKGGRNIFIISLKYFQNK